MWGMKEYIVGENWGRWGMMDGKIVEFVRWWGLFPIVCGDFLIKEIGKSGCGIKRLLGEGRF